MCPICGFSNNFRISCLQTGLQDFRSLLLPLVLISLFSGSSGHGRLLDPPSRASMWRLGFDSPPDYDDHQGYCGGKSALWNRFSGRCGVCGDPAFPTPRPHERGGRYYSGIPTRTYQSGEEITVVMGITANHRGWVEFRVCAYDDPQYGDLEFDDDGDFVEVSQDCLDRNLLELENGETRYYLPEPYSSGEHSVTVYLPDGLSCENCLFQWKWNVGNSWGTDPDGTSCIGCGEQEQFYACADIIIEPTDDWRDTKDRHFKKPRHRHGGRKSRGRKGKGHHHRRKGRRHHKNNKKHKLGDRRSHQHNKAAINSGDHNRDRSYSGQHPIDYVTQIVPITMAAAPKVGDTLDSNRGFFRRVDEHIPNNEILDGTISQLGGRTATDILLDVDKRGFWWFLRHSPLLARMPGQDANYALENKRSEALVVKLSDGDEFRDRAGDAKKGAVGIQHLESTLKPTERPTKPTSSFWDWIKARNMYAQHNSGTPNLEHEKSKVELQDVDTTKGFTKEGEEKSTSAEIISEGQPWWDRLAQRLRQSQLGKLLSRTARSLHTSDMPINPPARDVMDERTNRFLSSVLHNANLKLATNLMNETESNHSVALSRPPIANSSINTSSNAPEKGPVNKGEPLVQLLLNKTHPGDKEGGLAEFEAPKSKAMAIFFPLNKTAQVNQLLRKQLSSNIQSTQHKKHTSAPLQTNIFQALAHPELLYKDMIEMWSSLMGKTSSKLLTPTTENGSERPTNVLSLKREDTNNLSMNMTGISFGSNLSGLNKSQPLPLGPTSIEFILPISKRNRPVMGVAVSKTTNPISKTFLPPNEHFSSSQSLNTSLQIPKADYSVRNSQTEINKIEPPSIPSSKIAKPSQIIFNWNSSILPQNLKNGINSRVVKNNNVKENSSETYILFNKQNKPPTFQNIHGKVLQNASLQNSLKLRREEGDSSNSTHSRPGVKLKQHDSSLNAFKPQSKNETQPLSIPREMYVTEQLSPFSKNTNARVRKQQSKNNVASSKAHHSSVLRIKEQAEPMGSNANDHANIQSLQTYGFGHSNTHYKEYEAHNIQVDDDEYNNEDYHQKYQETHHPDYNNVELDNEVYDDERHHVYNEEQYSYEDNYEYPVKDYIGMYDYEFHHEGHEEIPLREDDNSGHQNEIHDHEDIKFYEYHNGDHENLEYQIHHVDDNHGTRSGEQKNIHGHDAHHSENNHLEESHHEKEDHHTDHNHNGHLENHEHKQHTHEDNQKEHLHEDHQDHDHHLEHGSSDHHENAPHEGHHEGHSHEDYHDVHEQNEEHEDEDHHVEHNEDHNHDDHQEVHEHEYHHEDYHENDHEDHEEHERNHKDYEEHEQDHDDHEEHEHDHEDHEEHEHDNEDYEEHEHDHEDHEEHEHDHEDYEEHEHDHADHEEHEHDHEDHEEHEHDHEDYEHDHEDHEEHELEHEDYEEHEHEEEEEEHDHEDYEEHEHDDEEEEEEHEHEDYEEHEHEHDEEEEEEEHEHEDHEEHEHEDEEEEEEHEHEDYEEHEHEHDDEEEEEEHDHEDYEEHEHEDEEEEEDHEEHEHEDEEEEEEHDHEDHEHEHDNEEEEEEHDHEDYEEHEHEDEEEEEDHEEHDHDDEEEKEEHDHEDYEEHGHEDEEEEEEHEHEDHEEHEHEHEEEEEEHDHEDHEEHEHEHEEEEEEHDHEDYEEHDHEDEEEEEEHDHEDHEEHEHEHEEEEEEHEHEDYEEHEHEDEEEEEEHEHEDYEEHEHEHDDEEEEEEHDHEDYEEHEHEHEEEEEEHDHEDHEEHEHEHEEEEEEHDHEDHEEHEHEHEEEEEEHEHEDYEEHDHEDEEEEEEHDHEDYEEHEHEDEEEEDEHHHGDHEDHEEHEYEDDEHDDEKDEDEHHHDDHEEDDDADDDDHEEEDYSDEHEYHHDHVDPNAWEFHESDSHHDNHHSDIVLSNDPKNTLVIKDLGEYFDHHDHEDESDYEDHYHEDEEYEEEEYDYHEDEHHHEGCDHEDYEEESYDEDDYEEHHHDNHHGHDTEHKSPIFPPFPDLGDDDYKYEYQYEYDAKGGYDYDYSSPFFPPSSSGSKPSLGSSSGSAKSPLVEKEPVLICTEEYSSAEGTGEIGKLASLLSGRRFFVIPLSALHDSSGNSKTTPKSDALMESPERTMSSKMFDRNCEPALWPVSGSNTVPHQGKAVSSAASKGQVDFDIWKESGGVVVSDVKPKTTVTSCIGVGDWAKIEGMSEWCLINCERGFCPSTHCLCV